MRVARIIVPQSAESQIRARGAIVDRLPASCYFFLRLMIQRLPTIFLLLALAVNAFSVVPPHAGGEGCGSEDCCAKARQDAPESTPAVLCCVINCEQNAETNSNPATVIRARQGQNLPPLAFASTYESVSYSQRAKFPSSPTRHIAGSSARYLEHNAFLI